MYIFGIKDGTAREVVGVNATRLKTKDKRRSGARRSQLNYKRMIWYILNINEEGGFCEHSQNIIDRYVDLLSCSKQDSKLTLDVATSKLKLGMTTRGGGRARCPKNRATAARRENIKYIYVSNGDVVVFLMQRAG